MTMETGAAEQRPEDRTERPGLITILIDAFVEARRLRADLHRRYPTTPLADG